MAMPAVLLLLALGLGSGLSLERSPRLMLGLHLASGLAAGPALAIFLCRHWWRRRAGVGRHGNARYGYLTLLTVSILLASGIGLLPWTNWSLLAWLHRLAAVLLVVDLAIHGTWRARQRLRRPRRPPRLRRAGRWQARPATLLGGGGLMLLAGVFGLVGGRDALASPAGARPAAVPVDHDSLREAGLAHETLPPATECAACHGQLTASWSESAHAHAATDRYYQALATLFMQERGVEAVRYCAGCHNPIGLMRGEIDVGARVEAGDEAQAYEARALGVSLAISPQAAEGVTCVVCHRAGEMTAATGATLAPISPGSSGPLAALALRARPEGHRQAMAPEVLAEAALCGGCHNLATPDGLLLEPTYDEWLASPYPAEGITCQDCHMPEAAGATVDSTVGGTATVHGGLPGAPSSLAGMSDSAGLLKRAATLALAWRPSDGPGLAATVTVTNSGAGHYLPTGADDLRQLWLEVTVRDAAGLVVWQQGALGPGGRLADEAIRFGKVLGDDGGRPVTLHRFWIASQILQDTRLAPKESRQITFDFGPLDQGRGPFSLSARLLYRDVPPGFAEFALEQAITEWPAIEVTRAELAGNE
jgi:hypothetical protein